MSKARNNKRGLLALKARRDSAMERPELRMATAPRVAPDGPTSFPSKTIDADVRAMIDREIERRRQCSMA